MVSVGGMSLLDRALQACGGAGRTMVVGPHRATVRPVHHVQESPVRGGPPAALAAGVSRVRAPFVVVLAAGLPFVSLPTLVARWHGWQQEKNWPVKRSPVDISSTERAPVRCPNFSKPLVTRDATCGA
ncbi:NTP transferase domain-containing protein [Streptomyces celluloflavus]|uniref:NTP transferase domain-containing protein n=1 Tax=Streptomyces celluloflavus TaxID=58344 RepID=UPI0036B24913